LQGAGGYSEVVSGASGFVLTVNASAAEIIRLFCDGLDIDAIADSLHEKYGVPEEQVHADVDAILKKLE
jgi:hypothetical protein